MGLERCRGRTQCRNPTVRRCRLAKAETDQQTTTKNSAKQNNLRGEEATNGGGFTQTTRALGAARQDNDVKCWCVPENSAQRRVRRYCRTMGTCHWACTIEPGQRHIDLPAATSDTNTPTDTQATLPRRRISTTAMVSSSSAPRASKTSARRAILCVFFWRAENKNVLGAIPQYNMTPVIQQSHASLSHLNVARCEPADAAFDERAQLNPIFAGIDLRFHPSLCQSRK
jgi:hypothetical protein